MNASAGVGSRRSVGGFKGWCTGERGVITDISFQRGDRDIKVARGNHYSDIVRPEPLSLSLSLFLRFLIASSAPRLFRSVFPRAREGGRVEGGGPLSEFLVRVAVTLSQIHSAVGEFPLVHAGGIGTRAAFQSREFPRRFLPLLPPGLFSRPPPRRPSVRPDDRLENGAAGRIREALLNGLYLICARGPSEGRIPTGLFARRMEARGGTSAFYRILPRNWKTPKAARARARRMTSAFPNYRRQAGIIQRPVIARSIFPRVIRQDPVGNRNRAELNYYRSN